MRRLALAALVLLAAATPAAAVPTVNGEFDLPGGFEAKQIAQGPDGNMWATLDGGATNDVAKITPAGGVTEYNLPDADDLTGITAGPDGNLWATLGNGVVRFSAASPTTTDDFFEVQNLVQAHEIIAGPDGNLWTGANDRLWKIPTSGVEEEILGANLQQAKGIAASTDGRIWIVDQGLNAIVSFNLAGGDRKQYDIAGTFTPRDVAGGANGQVAFTFPDAASSFIGRLVHNGTALPTVVGTAIDPSGITFGADGAYWTAQFAANTLGRLTTDGQYTTLSGFGANSGPRWITTGPGNTLWVVFEGFGIDYPRIGRISGIDPPPPPPGGGTPGGPGGPIATVDTVKPVIGTVAMTETAFLVGSASTPLVAGRRRPPTGTEIRFTLSEPARVRIRFEKQLPGRRRRGRCVAPRRTLRRAPRCTRFRSVGTLTRTGVQGRNVVKFSGRIGRRALSAGRYRLTIDANDSAGNAAAQQRRKTFRILPRPRRRR